MNDLRDPLAGMDREQKLQLLGRLLNELHAEGVVSQAALVGVASEVMTLDYHDDEDLIVFHHLAHETEEEMKRGEIWLINLDPTIGAEIAKKRPALILNEDGVGKLPLRIVAPITNWKAHYHLVPWMVRLPSDDISGLDKESSADVFQTRSISTKRMISKLGEASVPQMALAERGVAVVFGLTDRPN